MISKLLRHRWPYFMTSYDFVAFAIVIYLVLTGRNLALAKGATATETRLLIIGFAGLALSVYLAYANTIKPFLRKPRFHVAVDQQWSPPTQHDDTGSWFYRLRIENYGLTPAQSCVGRLLDVRTANGERIVKFDPLDLYWTRQDGKHVDFSPIVLQGHRDFSFLDIAQVKLNVLTLRVVIPPPMTLKSGPKDSASPGNQPDLRLPGHYFARIGIYSEGDFVSPTFYRIECSELSSPLSATKSPCQIKKIRTIPRPDHEVEQRGDEP